TVNERGVRTGLTKQEEDVSLIYLMPNVATPRTLAHELLGHFYLAVKGAPYQHEGDPSKVRPGEHVDQEFLLTKEHGIKVPTGEIFKGRVWDFINTYVAPP